VRAVPQPGKSGDAAIVILTTSVMPFARPLKRFAKDGGATAAWALSWQLQVLGA